MKKLLKTITFLSLAMCLMLNSDFVYADEERCQKHVHTSGRYRCGLLECVTEYVPHDVLETLAKNANKRQDEEKKAQIALISALGMAAGGVGGFVLGGNVGPGVTVGGALAGGLAYCVTSSIQNEGEKWLEASARNGNCGVKMHYVIYPGEHWEYGSFDPQ